MYGGQFILLLIFLDPCEKVTCNYNAVCSRQSDLSHECVCPVCSRVSFEPVCASNGRTYSSECHMKQDSCNLRENLVLLKRAPCGKYIGRKMKIDFSHHEFSNLIMTVEGDITLKLVLGGKGKA